jgi:hypothetical protein
MNELGTYQGASTIIIVMRSAIYSLRRNIYAEANYVVLLVKVYRHGYECTYYCCAYEGIHNFLLPSVQRL